MEVVYIFLNMIWLQAFVSEYAVWKTDAGRGTLLASLAEAAFLTGLEKNRWNRFKYLTRFLSVGYMVITPKSLCVNFKWCICQSSHHDLIVLYFDGFFRDSDVVEMACHAPLFVNDILRKSLFLWLNAFIVSFCYCWSDITVIVFEQNIQMEPRRYCLQYLATLWDS